MDDRTRLFLWVVASMWAFGLLFACFGAVTGFVSRREGRAGGTALGLGVARAFARLTDRVESPSVEGVLVGGVDGLIFGCIVGLAIGLFAGWHVPAEWQVLKPLLLGATLLVLGAILMGLFASGVEATGPRAVLGLFTGGVAGALLGFSLGGAGGLFVGVLGGAASGALAVRLHR